jgi:hypothetical protein
VFLTSVAGLPSGLAADEPGFGDVLRLDMGGSIPLDAKLTRLGDPVSGEYLKLSPGVQMDTAFDYKVTPWLLLGGELGFQFNGVDSVGGRTWV